MACEDLHGFGPILGRIKNPATRQATWPEVIVATALVKLGYTPEFEPTIEGKNPDLGLVVDGEDVYIEVIAPEESMEYKQALQTVEALAKNLCDRMNGTRLEVLLEQVSDHQTALEMFMQKTPASNQVKRLAGVGLVRYGLLGSDVPNAGPTIERDAACPITGVAWFRGQGNVLDALAVVRFPFDDDRVQRLMYNELCHFPRSTRNLLVMNVSGNPGAGMQSWMPVVQRRFQPHQNQRLGAVALFRQGIDSATGAIRQQWSVLCNNYALLPVPQRLLNDLASLDQPL
jgi:hypothetical protein